MLVHPYRVTSQMPVTWFIKSVLSHLLDIRNINRGCILRPRHLVVERVEGVRECRRRRIIIIIRRRWPQIWSIIVHRISKQKQMISGRCKWTIWQAFLQPVTIQKRTCYLTSYSFKKTLKKVPLFMSKPTSLVDLLYHHQILLWNFLSLSLLML